MDPWEEQRLQMIEDHEVDIREDTIAFTVYVFLSFLNAITTILIIITGEPWQWVIAIFTGAAAFIAFGGTMVFDARIRRNEARIRRLKEARNWESVSVDFSIDEGAERELREITDDCIEEE